MLSFIFRNIPSSHTLVDTFFNWFLMFPHHTTSLVFFFSIIKIPALLQNTPVAPTLVVAKLIFIFFSFLTIPPSCCRWNLCQFISYFLNTWYFLSNLLWISPTFFLSSYFEYVLYPENALLILLSWSVSPAFVFPFYFTCFSFLLLFSQIRKDQAQ